MKSTNSGHATGDKQHGGSGSRPVLAVRNKRVLIQWPAEEEFDDVASQLRQISRIGRSSEAGGDCFKSGDLAYQLREILRTTKELLKRSQRTER